VIHDAHNPGNAPTKLVGCTSWRRANRWRDLRRGA
jgi:hypothetical protein